MLVYYLFVQTRRTMTRVSVSLLLVLGCLVLCGLVESVRSMSNDDDLSGFPERPNVFRSPQELKEYLRALNEYFAIAGRPRYGYHLLCVCCVCG
jgi:hypothetical protein